MQENQGIIIAVAVLIILVVGVTLNVISMIRKSRKEKLTKEEHQKALDSATKVLYIKTADDELFTAYEMSIETKKMKEARFSYNEIPIKTEEELSTWLEADASTFLLEKEWADVNISHDENALNAYREINDICMQDGESAFRTMRDTYWFLQFLDDDNKGLLSVAIDRKSQNQEGLKKMLFSSRCC